MQIDVTVRHKLNGTNVSQSLHLDSLKFPIGKLN